MKTIAILMKAPEAGKVKTRMQPHLNTDESATLSALLAEAVLSRTAEFKSSLEDAQVVLACAPHQAYDFFSSLKADHGAHLIDQAQADLGARMFAIAACYLKKDQDQIIFLGTDAPTIPNHFLKTCFEKLSNSDAVIGPSTDGGYYVLGISGRVMQASKDRFHHAVFKNKTWGSESVFLETLKALKTANIDFDLLPYWYDLDRFDDLKFLALHLPFLFAQKIVKPCKDLENLLSFVNKLVK